LFGAIGPLLLDSSAGGRVGVYAKFFAKMSNYGLRHLQHQSFSNEHLKKADEGGMKPK
jgi:hypothetical protein